MSYIRNYVLIASALYLLSAIKHYFQFSIFWMPWYALKTTNLFIMYHMERLYAHTKKGVYHNQILGIQTMDFDALRERMSTYGLIRDKLYEIGAYFWYKLSHIFGIQRGNKRNYCYYSAVKLSATLLHWLFHSQCTCKYLFYTFEKWHASSLKSFNHS